MLVFCQSQTHLLGSLHDCMCSKRNEIQRLEKIWLRRLEATYCTFWRWIVAGIGHVISEDIEQAEWAKTLGWRQKKGWTKERTLSSSIVLTTYPVWCDGQRGPDYAVLRTFEPQICSFGHLVCWPHFEYANPLIAYVCIKISHENDWVHSTDIE